MREPAFPSYHGRGEGKRGRILWGFFFYLFFIILVEFFGGFLRLAQALVITCKDALCSPLAEGVFRCLLVHKNGRVKRERETLSGAPEGPGNTETEAAHFGTMRWDCTGAFWWVGGLGKGVR